jgi:hypothetical protein
LLQGGAVVSHPCRKDKNPAGIVPMAAVGEVREKAG